jgi:hypothetical protein
MNEWTVITTVIAFVSFGFVILKPILALNGAIIKLTITIETLKDHSDTQQKVNDGEHELFKKELQEHNIKLTEYGVRICCLEEK